MKVFTVVGARPQFIKAATVSRSLSAVGVTEKIIHTGQHFDEAMSDQFFTELEIPTPWKNLGISGGTHGAMTGKMLEAIEAVFIEEHPDWVIVYGDTNSTLAGALAAAKLHIPVAHVEAGLRSFNRYMPEEINRVLADHVSDRLYCPTTVGNQNLVNEGISIEKIRQVGDVMYDAALYYGEKQSDILKRLGLHNYVLATIHRAENTDDPDRLRAIIEGLRRVGNVVLPLHPRTRKVLEQNNLSTDGLKIIDPVGYLEMVALEKGATVIATDSGGVQKEALFYRVPCVTLRDETEWKESVALGWNRIASPKGGPEAIASAIEGAIGSSGEDANPYGDGTAAAQIAKDLLS